MQIIEHHRYFVLWRRNRSMWERSSKQCS